MKALLKTIGVIIGIIAILFVAIAVIVPVYFHPNDYKDEIAAAVQEKTGREMKIHGDISLSFFPWLAIELGALELGNAPGFSGERFASLEKMEIGVKLLPLLSRHLEMRTVTLHGLELNLARDKNGRTNWDDLAARDEQAAQEKQPGDEGEKPGLPIAILGVGGLDIRDGALRWRDAQNGQTYRLECLDIETGAIAQDLSSGGDIAGEPFDLRISFDVEGNAPEINGHVDINTKLTLNLAANTYRLSKLNVLAGLAGAAVPNHKATLNLGADVTVDLAKQDLHVKDLRLAAGQIDASGLITVNQLLDNPTFSGKLQLESFNPRTLLAELGQQVPETADPKVLTSASLSAAFHGTADRVQLKPLDIQMDKTGVNGSFSIVNFSKPVIHFDLGADAIDADAYLPPKTPEAKQAMATPGGAAAGASQLPLDTLRGINVEGKARIGKLKIANLDLADLALTVKARDGLIRVNPVGMNLYQGSYAGDIGIDARGGKARVTLDEKLTGIRTAPLLRDLTGNDLLSGKLRFALDLQLTGAGPEGMKKTMKGNADFSLSDGMLKGIDIVHMICDAAAQFNNLTGSSRDKPGSGTQFQEFAGKLPIANGRIGVNNTLQLKAPLLRVRGVSGNVDVGANRLDNVKIIVKPSFTCKGQGGRALDQLNGADIPITCNGPMEGRSCLPDAKVLAGILLGIVGERKVEKLKEDLKGKVEEELKDKLKDELGEKAAEGLGEALGGQLKGLFGR